jgi:hypothetical protein
VRWGDERILRAYYLASPLFAVFVFGLKSPIRALGLQSLTARIVYYAAAFAIGLAMFRWPGAAPFLALGESAANLTLLMASVLVPIWSLPETMDAGVVADLPDRVVNLALSGSVLVYSFYRNQARAGSSPS